MKRLINKYKWINVSSNLRENISVITTFFNSVLQDNAGRSVRGETVLDFKDQEDLLKAALVAHNLPSSVPTSHAPRNDNDFNRQKSRSFPGNFNNSFVQPNNQGFSNRNNQPGGVKPNYSASTQSNQRKPFSNQPRPRASFTNLGVCFNFNNDNCKNPTTSVGCKHGNRELVHVCTFLTFLKKKKKIIYWTIISLKKFNWGCNPFICRRFVNSFYKFIL